MVLCLVTLIYKRVAQVCQRCLSFLFEFVFWCLLGPFLCCVSLRLHVFSLLSWLFWLSVLAKLLAIKTPLKTPIRGMEIISTKPRPKSAYDFFLGLAFPCFIVCFSCRNIFHTPMTWYSLFVLEVPLNTNQPLYPIRLPFTDSLFGSPTNQLTKYGYCVSMRLTFTDTL